MATGDNVLTAISVARQCELVKPDTEVFLGDLQINSFGMKEIVWKSTTTLKHSLDQNTLKPLQDYFFNESKSSDSKKGMTIEG